MRVLVVDDSPVIRKHLGAMIRGVRGVEAVHEAIDAFDGLQSAIDHAPDMVVLDIHMPGRSGLDLLQDLERVEPRPRTVVVLTNDPTDQHRRESFARGAHHFLDKSTDVDRLLVILNDAIRTEQAAHDVRHDP